MKQQQDSTLFGTPFGSRWREFRLPATLLIAIIVLILLLCSFPSGISVARTKPHADTEWEDTGDYVHHLEERLGALLSSINGVRELSVMITLESGAESVYATENRSNVNLLSDTLTDSQKRVENKNDREDAYIILKDASGGESPVLLKRLEPIVQGVAIVCVGAEDPQIRQKLVETTAVVLGIPTSHVSVVAK